MRARIAAVLACSLCAMNSATLAAEWRGKASYYTLKGKTASGDRVRAMSAAHRTLPFGSRIRVVNLSNHKSVVLTVKDRGPFVSGRVVDVTKDAAEALEFVGRGVAEVSIATLD